MSRIRNTGRQKNPFTQVPVPGILKIVSNSFYLAIWIDISQECPEHLDQINLNPGITDNQYGTDPDDWIRQNKKL